MSAEMVAAWTWRKVGTPYDAAAGHAVVDTITLTDEAADDDAAANWADERGMSEYEIRQELHHHIDVLKDSEDVVIITAPDGVWETVMAGGSTFGDSPNDTFDAINDLIDFPQVMRALGFHVTD